MYDECAERAIAAIDGTHFHGRRIFVRVSSNWISSQ
jgi:hypothetical protein